MTPSYVLTVNAGSSSLKFSAFEHVPGAPPLEIASASISDIHKDPHIACTIEGVDQSKAASVAVTHATSPSPGMIVAMATFLTHHLQPRHIAAIGHRIVHGGLAFTGPVVATDAVLESLSGLSCLAPSHQPHNLAAVHALEVAMPGIVQTLSFDTAFHHTQPRLAQLYALPRALSDSGILRFGFHGLSYAHVSQIRDEIFGRLTHNRTVVAHLGSGASACALLDGRCVATTMGLTALDGLPMATRCGDLDPGVVLHLIQDLDLSPDDTNDLLYNKSGLLGLSGLSSDMRVLRQSDSPNAREALDVYAYRVAREIGSLVTALRGLDALVFTAGIGQNDADARREICDHLSWLGVELDTSANACSEKIISSGGSRVAVAVVPANEERVIAGEAIALTLPA